MGNANGGRAWLMCEVSQPATHTQQAHDTGDRIVATSIIHSCCKQTYLGHRRILSATAAQTV
eukprot:3620248-Amphidinium_carterae.1